MMSRKKYELKMFHLMKFMRILPKKVAISDPRDDA